MRKVSKQDFLEQVGPEKVRIIAVQKFVLAKIVFRGIGWPDGMLVCSMPVNRMGISMLVDTGYRIADIIDMLDYGLAEIAGEFIFFND